MAAAVLPPSNITLTPKMTKKYRPLLLSHAILGDDGDTILSRILLSFFELLGEPVWGERWTKGMTMTRAEGVLHDILRIKEPRGLTFVKDEGGIGGTVRSKHIIHTIGFPKQITDRLVEATRRAYVSAATDDPSVRDVILEIKNADLAKTTTVWNRFPTEVTSTDELKGFRNVFYTTYYPPLKEGKKRRAVIIKGRRNIINEALAGAYTDLAEPKAERDEGEEEAGGEEAGEEEAGVGEPAVVFTKELARTMGLTIGDAAGTLTHTGTLTGTSLLTLAYQTERGPLLGMYPAMILPGEVDVPIVVMAEQLGKLVSNSQDAPDQGDIDVIRTELKALEPTKGRADALLKHMDKITDYLLVSKPFKPYARSTYLYTSRSSMTSGHPMKALRTIRIK